MLYLDSSALVKAYAIEPGHEAVQVLLAEHAGMLFTSIVTYAEVLSAICRAYRGGRMTDGEYRETRSHFRQNWREILAIELKEDVLAEAERLIGAHGLRGFDAVHLCSARWLDEPRLTFACFDQRLRAAAAAEGLLVVPELSV